MNSDDSPQDQLMSYGVMHGWRLEVWKSGFWLDTYEYRIRPVPKSGDSPDADPPFLGVPTDPWTMRKLLALRPSKKICDSGI